MIPGDGFGTHQRKDIEILTYVLEGELVPKDSLGTGSVIRPGNVQIMSAGTGIQYSEFNNIDLVTRSAADFYHAIMAALKAIEIEISIWTMPQENICPLSGFRYKTITDRNFVTMRCGKSMYRLATISGACNPAAEGAIF